MEETGTVINVGTLLFIVLLTLVIAGCIALLLNAVLSGTFNSVSYALSTNFEVHPNANLTSIILILLAILHGIGYYCQYVKTPLTGCHISLLVTGSLTLLVAAAAVLMVTRHQQLGIEPNGYHNTAATAMQLVVLTAFGVCMWKSGCFGKCNSNARLVFYVFVGIYATWLLAYLAACASYAMFHNKHESRRTGLDPYDKIRESYKRIPCVNYVLLIALTLSSYQVNFCCVPLTGTDWTFLLLFGTCAGILLSVVMNYQGGGRALNLPMPYILCASAAVIMAVLLMYSYFKEPFAQVVPDKKYTASDLLFIVLALVIASITISLLIKWEGGRSGVDWNHYALPPVMVVCTAMELGMLHLGWVRGGSCAVVWQVVMVMLVIGWIVTLAMVVIESCNGGSGYGWVYMVSEAVYPVLVLHMALLGFTVVVCHYHMPFPGKYQLWHWSLGLWDTMLFLLVLESLVVLVVSIVGVYQEHGYENGCYILVIVHAIICGTALGIVHFKEPLSQYWTKDRVACGVLSLVSLVALMGAAYNGMKKQPGESLHKPGFYCLIAYGLITFGGALFYGFRSGLVQSGCFTKKSTTSSTQLQGSDEAVSSTESTAESTEDTLPEVTLQQDNTDVM